MREHEQDEPGHIDAGSQPTRAVVGNLRVAVSASYHKLSAQAQMANALDAKLLGLLGFFAVADSLLLTLPHGLRHGMALLLAGAALGSLSCLLGSIACPTPDIGPPPERFYADHGLEPEESYLADLLSELTAASRANLNALSRRRRAVTIAVAAPVILACSYMLTTL